ASQDLHGVVFHPSLLRIELGKLFLRHGGDGALVGKEDGARAGRALVERKDVVHACPAFGPSQTCRTASQQPTQVNFNPASITSKVFCVSVGSPKPFCNDLLRIPVPATPYKCAYDSSKIY